MRSSIPTARRRTKLRPGRLKSLRSDIGIRTGSGTTLQVSASTGSGTLPPGLVAGRARTPWEWLTARIYSNTHDPIRSGSRIREERTSGHRTSGDRTLVDWLQVGERPPTRRLG